MGLRSVTSLPGSADGHMPLDSPDGPMTVRVGRGVARANLTARQAKEKGLLTSGTFGQPSTTSSQSAALASSLGSRLRQRLATAGSTLFKQTWKEQVTPSQRMVWLPVVSGHRTKGSGCTLLEPWSTPRANKWGFPDAHGSHEAPIAGWVSPTSQDASRGGLPARPWDTGVPLTQQVALLSEDDPQKRRMVPTRKGDKMRWETSEEYWERQPPAIPDPTVAPWPTPRAEERDQYNSRDSYVSLGLAAKKVAGWPTPQSHDDRERGNTMADHHSFPHDLPNMATWISPQAKDWRSGQGERYLTGSHAVSLNDQATITIGERVTGSLVKTEGRGQLNPAFSLWLQGFPTEWALCAARVTRSSLNAAKRLSKRI
jgi:hypothetical protein